MAQLEWYYAQDNQRRGPISAADLKQLADRGELKPGDLVWRDGMDDWLPANKVKGLFEPGVPAPGSPPPSETFPLADSPASAARGEMPRRDAEAPPSGTVKPPPKPLPDDAHRPLKQPEPAFDPSPQGSRHLFDAVLQFARTQFPLQFIELSSNLFTQAGHYGLYLGMAALFVFSLLLGAKINEVNVILLGTGCVGILLVLQYAASRFSGALRRLNRSTPVRMSSSALLDCFALLNMFGGLIGLLALAVWAVRVGPLCWVLSAVAVFILCEYMAVVALNPKSLNLGIAPEATAGEEAIGALSFLMKLALRVVPVAFGVGVAWGTLTLLYALFLLFSPPDLPENIGPVAEGKPAGEMVPEDNPTMFRTVGGDPSENDSPDDLPEMGLAMLPARAAATSAACLLLLSAAVPFLAYLVFITYYLAVDIARAILSLPAKLDALAPPPREPPAD